MKKRWKTLKNKHTSIKPVLMYNYPPATPEIVTNIGLELLRNKRFYIKVCHLMNLMCLKCPFESEASSIFTQTNSSLINDQPVLKKSLKTQLKKKYQKANEIPNRNSHASKNEESKNSASLNATLDLISSSKENKDISEEEVYSESDISLLEDDITFENSRLDALLAGKLNIRTISGVINKVKYSNSIKALKKKKYINMIMKLKKQHRNHENTKIKRITNLSEISQKSKAIFKFPGFKINLLENEGEKEENCLSEERDVEERPEMLGSFQECLEEKQTPFFDYDQYYSNYDLYSYFHNLSNQINQPSQKQPFPLFSLSASQNIGKNQDFIEADTKQEDEGERFERDFTDDNFEEKHGECKQKGEIEKECEKCISKEHILKNKASMGEINRILKREYEEGELHNIIYVKNIHKLAKESHFYSLVKAALGNLFNSNTEINVNLFKKGRMKGQAFITLQSTQLAQIIINTTNGYKLFNKPLIIHFAKKNKT